MTNTLNEIRYAERLSQRTARLYRHVSATFTFLSVLGGSGVIASAAVTPAPTTLPILGAVLLATAAALNLAMRPADKAAAADADAKRYAQLRSGAATMSQEDLAKALDKLREGDIQEVESLREVAYNDVAFEMGRGDAAIPLTWHQRLLRSVA